MLVSDCFVELAKRTVELPQSSRIYESYNGGAEVEEITYTAQRLKGTNINIKFDSPSGTKNLMVVTLTGR